jgi:hypothetical protein
VSLLKAKLPKSVNAFRQIVRKQSERKPLQVPTAAQRNGGGSGAMLGLLRNGGSTGQQRDAALPTAPLRPGAMPSKATSLGRGFGRGQAPPRKPLPAMTRPVGANPTTAAAAAAVAAAAAAAAPAPAARAPAASDTDEEEEPSRDDESVADDDEEDDVEDDDDNAAVGGGGGGAVGFLRMETILRTLLLRAFFDEWMPVAKRSAEVLLFDAIQQLLYEGPTSGVEAVKRASAVVALHMEPGARQEVALPAELVRQIKQELSVAGASLPMTLFGLVQNAVLAALDRTVLPLFRGSDQYLGLLGHVVTMQQSGEDLFDNPFLDRNEIQETTEPNDDEQQNPFVGGDIDELADLAQNLHLEDDNLIIGLSGFE